MIKESKENYQCSECGLHYYDEKIALTCEQFCKEYHACSLEITKHAIENSGELPA